MERFLRSCVYANVLALVLISRLWTTCPATSTQLPTHQDPRLKAANVIVVMKGKRRLALYQRGRLKQCHRMGLGFTPIGHKQREGDGKTPLGWYRTSDKPWSKFQGAILIHYPNAKDARAGRSRGAIDDKQLATILQELAATRAPPQQTPLGGEILIHAGGSLIDWTYGCMALSRYNLKTLRDALPPGKDVDILILP